MNLQRVDGEAFRAGRFTIRIAVDLSAAKTDDDRHWKGRVVMPSTVRFAITGPPSSQPERLAAHLQAARKAEFEDRLLDALAAFQAALSTDATNSRALTGLGLVFLELGQFRQAVATLEVLLARFPREREFVPYLLARAYLGIHDDSNAVRVLRNAGVGADRLAQTIAGLRKPLGRRPRYR